MTYELLKTALNVSSLRQEVISSNISNANTADYKANRVAFENFLSNASNKTLVRTDDKHISSANSLPIIQESNATAIQDNGNNVDIDFEMAELSANNIYYDAIVSQLNAKYSMMRTSFRR